MIVDADGAIVGRLGARVAKALLNGENVVVINAENAVITGGRYKIIEKYKKRRKVKQKATPEHSPHWPRRPDLLLKRIIRGMLPFDKPKGKKAFKRLRVYIGVPEEFSGKEGEFEKIKKEFSGKYIAKHITINDLCKELGWRV